MTFFLFNLSNIFQRVINTVFNNKKAVYIVFLLYYKYIIKRWWSANVGKKNIIKK